MNSPETEQKPEKTDEPSGTQQKPSDAVTDTEDKDEKPDDTVPEPEEGVTGQNGSQPEEEVQLDKELPENENILPSDGAGGGIETDSIETESEKEENQMEESVLSAGLEKESDPADENSGKESGAAEENPGKESGAAEENPEKESGALPAVSVKYTQPAEKTAPRTGDFSNLTLWAVLAAGSVLLAGAVLMQRKNSGF